MLSKNLNLIFNAIKVECLQFSVILSKANGLIVSVLDWICWTRTIHCPVLHYVQNGNFQDFWSTFIFYLSSLIIKSLRIFI